MKTHSSRGNTVKIIEIAILRWHCRWVYWVQHGLWHSKWMPSLVENKPEPGVHCPPRNLWAYCLEVLTTILMLVTIVPLAVVVAWLLWAILSLVACAAVGVLLLWEHIPWMTEKEEQ